MPDMVVVNRASNRRNRDNRNGSNSKSLQSLRRRPNQTHRQKADKQNIGRPTAETVAQRSDGHAEYDRRCWQSSERIQRSRQIFRIVSIRRWRR